MEKKNNNPNREGKQLNINANSSGFLEISEYFNKVKTAQSREKININQRHGN